MTVTDSDKRPPSAHPHTNISWALNECFRFNPPKISGDIAILTMKLNIDKNASLSESDCSMAIEHDDTYFFDFIVFQVSTSHSQ